MRRVLPGLAISLLIDFLLVLAAIAIFEDWPSACFFVLMSWPLIWFVIIVKSLKNVQVDMIKMQTYFNVDAIRRNTNKP